MKTACALAIMLAAGAVLAQPPQASRPLPAETSGVAAIARELIAAFGHTDVVALGEAHGRFQVDADLRLAILRNPEFSKRVHFIEIECASVTEQRVLDRYIRGEDVARTELERVWKATAGTTNGFCDAPEYLAFLTAVRDVNAKLPASARIRVLAGHPGPVAGHGIESTAVSVLKEEVFAKRGKALVIFGAAHFYRDYPTGMLASMGDDMGLVRRLETEFPGRAFVVIPIGPLERPSALKADIVPDFQKFDRALTTSERPVLVSLNRAPFSKLSAEEFLGRTVTSCRGRGGCASGFKGSALTLGQMADAVIYVGAKLP